jgi:hypothetical protein
MGFGPVAGLVALVIELDACTYQLLETRVRAFVRYCIIPESGVKTTILERERFELVDFAEYVVDQVL